MCGIFGFAAKADGGLRWLDAQRLLEELFVLSESRGKESAGLYCFVPETRDSLVLKLGSPARTMLRSESYARALKWLREQAFANGPAGPARDFVILAHSRLVTNGAGERNENNQPVTAGDVVCVHNGIIVNIDAVWAAHPELTRWAEVDSEVIAALYHERRRAGSDASHVIACLMQQVYGSVATAIVDEAASAVVLATNTGDLFYSTIPTHGIFCFASEDFILEHALQVIAPAGLVVTWLEAGWAGRLDWQTFALNTWRIGDAETASNSAPALASSGKSGRRTDLSQYANVTVARRPKDFGLLRYDEERVREQERCRRCILPMQFPFISFDTDGVCNYCRNYVPKYRGLDKASSKQKFIAQLEGYRRANGRPDAIVAFSGGRDSSYGLHVIRREFGLLPLTFTYDWGMVTDLARRNIARICGRLGVRNILVSADIKRKRENIRLNVSAWLRRPALGLVPLFMAGDKHFFSVVNDIKRQTGIRLDLWCANPLENTDFKSGFCGVSPDFGKARVDYLSFGRRAKMAGYYLSEFARNPRYLNRSLLDTARAFQSYYFEERRDFFFIFQHFPWDEEEVNKTLVDEYDWELSPDSPSTWRIGDGTAAFYNYIYMTACGFTEFDTFRSNQIREGQLDRAEALAHVVAENRPRVESLGWYCDTIGVDFDATIKRINAFGQEVGGIAGGAMIGR